MKESRFSTANNTKVGDTIRFIEFPFYTGDDRLYNVDVIVTSIKSNKTGKRVEVNFSNGTCVHNIGFNTPFQPLTDKFLSEQSEERGWK